MSKKVVLIPIAEGSEEIEAVTIFDVLDRCGIQPLQLSVGPTKDVRLAHGLVIQAQNTLKEYIEQKCNGSVERFASTLDGILLPGGMPGATNLKESKEVEGTIIAMHHNKKLVGAICASPAVVLAPLGLLNSQTPATCYPAFKEKFGTFGISWSSSPVVYAKHANILTSQGPGTTAGFALVAASLLVGVETAKKVNSALLTSWEDAIESSHL